MFLLVGKSRRDDTTDITAIGVDDEQNVIVDLPDRFYPIFAIIAAIVPLLQCGTEENACCVIEAEPSLAQSVPALRLVPFEEHRSIYALSVLWSTARSARYPVAIRQLAPAGAGANVSATPFMQ